MTRLDILNEPEKAALITRGASAVLCLAGIVPGQGHLSQNTDIAVATINAAAQASVKTVMLCSSAAVYGRGNGAWTENMPTRPASLYGAAKLDMEKAARRQAALLGINLCCLRIGNIAGADAILGGWRPGFKLDQLANGLTPLRSYIGPHALADCLEQLLEQAERLPAVLNVSLPEAVRMGDLLRKAGFSWAPQPATEETIEKVVLNVDRLLQLVQFDKATQDVSLDWAKWEAQVASQ